METNYFCGASLHHMQRNNNSISCLPVQSQHFGRYSCLNRNPQVCTQRKVSGTGDTRKCTRIILVHRLSAICRAERIVKVGKANLPGTAPAMNGLQKRHVYRNSRASILIQTGQRNHKCNFQKNRKQNSIPLTIQRSSGIFAHT